MFEFRDRTKLDSEHIPNYTKDYKPPKERRGVPKFEDIDNPGEWHPMMYRLLIPTGKPYAYHQMPAGATPVGQKHSGPVRKVEGWDVYYDGSFAVDKTLTNLY